LDEVEKRNCPLFPSEIASAVEGLQGEQRQKILYALLVNDELSFTDLMKITEMSNSLLANYLKELKIQFLIEQYYEHRVNKEGYSFYRISEFGKRIIESLNNVMNPLPESWLKITRTIEIIESNDSNTALLIDSLINHEPLRTENIATSAMAPIIQIGRGKK
jgi:DNA-binding HxlR family transcriptional regulator